MEKIFLPGLQTGKEHWSADEAPFWGVVVPGGHGAHAAPDPLALHVPRGQGSHPPSLLSCSPKTWLKPASERSLKKKQLKIQKSRFIEFTRRTIISTLSCWNSFCSASSLTSRTSDARKRSFTWLVWTVTARTAKIGFSIIIFTSSTPF